MYICMYVYMDSESNSTLDASRKPAARAAGFPPKVLSGLAEVAPRVEFLMKSQQILARYVESSSR